MAKMKEVHVPTLTGTPLNWLVATAHHLPVVMARAHKKWYIVVGMRDSAFNPSSDWKDGGPLLKAHDVWLSSEEYEDKPTDYFASCPPHADVGEVVSIAQANDPLLAAMRAIAIKHFGVTAQVPTILLKGHHETEN